MAQIRNERETGAYDFGPEEPAVVCIEMLPHRFCTINGTTHCLGKEVVLKDGKMVKQWTNDPDGRLWIPGRLVGPLTTPQGLADRQGNIAPLAQVVGTRTEEEWRNEVDPLLKAEKEAEIEKPTAKRRRIPE